ncbi:MAG: prepilin-type N-terminal cleavage/methylation domain-containing protein [candidate division WOR-3 bacterium]|nr:MAG: prepilin-type N-terminal cleavage/methylation domain-containing protein [candidate division WOR-3 bacterium]
MNTHKSLKSKDAFMQGGFTLVEILVAITVLTLGILTISQLTLIGLRATNVNKQRIYARIAMTRVFENLHNRPSTDSLLIDDGDPTDLNDTGATADYASVIDDVEASYRYLARWNIADNTPEPNLKTVRIHILWGHDDRHHITSDLIKRM